MDECIKNVVHTQNGILFGHKKITFAGKWIELKKNHIQIQKDK